MVLICGDREAISVSTGHGGTRSHITAVLLLVLASLIASYVVQAGELDKVVAFNIAAQTLDKALLEFGAQAHVQVMFAWDSATAKMNTQEIKGNYSGRVALAELLKGTALQFVARGNTIEIIPKRGASIDPSESPSERGSPGIARDARKHPKIDPTNRQSSKKRETSDRSSEATELKQVVVTGTLIPGVRNLSSPLVVLSRADIDDSGASTLQQFMQQQSFDWGGGASEGTISDLAGGGTADNRDYGSGFNLRGLGNDATLVLINGQRIAPGNTDANFVDTSLIPLNAIERIEVEPAGASAIYGSDAVGGVVNLILRQSFQGAQTTVQYGTVTQGGTKELQVGQLAGSTWSSGSAIVGYEFYDRTPLLASDRTYLSQGAEPFALLPEQQRQSGFLSIHQNVTSAINIYVTALYGERTTHDTDAYGTYGEPPLFTVPEEGDTSVGEATLGTDMQVSSNNMLHLSLTDSPSHTHVVDYFDSSPSVNDNTSFNELSFDGDLTGSFLELPSGPLQFAVGNDYRREVIDVGELDETTFHPSRSILSGFLELNIPILGQRSASSLGPLLSASAAGRIDHYSDFGTTINPNIGITWHPLLPLKFRGTFGTSFVAPELSDLNPVPFEVVADSVPDPTTGGLSNVLEVYGGNSHLRPETADVFTTGLDFARGELRSSLTYYHIDFQNLILSIQSAGVNPNDALELESELGPSIVQRNPPPSEIVSLASTPGYVDFTGVPGGVNLSSIAAIINSTEQNLAHLRTEGIDLNLSYTQALTYGTMEYGFDGTYISKFQRQVTPETPAFSLLNTVYNPIDVKAKAKVAFTHGGWLLAAMVNYVNSYRDNRVPPAVPVASWTTMDVNLRYTVPYEIAFLKGTTVALSVINATNRSPPYVASPEPTVAPEITFDGANANTLGRFISLEISEDY